VNTASRLASSAAAGEMLLSETVYAMVAERFPDLKKRSLILRGKEGSTNARVLGAA
jgi:class 3 adenylate cyclase